MLLGLGNWKHPFRTQFPHDAACISLIALGTTSNANLLLQSKIMTMHQSAFCLFTTPETSDFPLTFQRTLSTFCWQQPADGGKQDCRLHGWETRLQDGRWTKASFYQCYRDSLHRFLAWPECSRIPVSLLEMPLLRVHQQSIRGCRPHHVHWFLW